MAKKQGKRAVGKRTAKTKPKAKRTVKKRAAKPKKSAAAPKKRAAKNGGGGPPLASLAPMGGNEGGVSNVVLFNAICVTVGCPTPELKRAVNAFTAKKATNAHVTANPTHSVRVVAQT